jgi:GAF domain-containing protein
VRARAIAHDGRWLGVLLLAEPRRRMLPRRPDEGLDAGGDVLELCLSRALMLRERQQADDARAQALRALASATPSERVRQAEAAAGDAHREVERMRARMEALERAAAHATEMLMDAHVDIDRRSQKHQRQTRVLYLLRKLMERGSQGMDPRALADEVVKTVSQAFGGSRCSLLLIDDGDVPELRLCAAVGLPPMVDSEAVRVPLGRGISGSVASSRMPLVVRDPEEGVTHPLMRDAWYTGPAFVSLPLLCRGQLLGVLNLSNFRAGTVDDQEVEQLRLVSLCVGLLVDHAGLAPRLFAGQPA